MEIKNKLRGTIVVFVLIAIFSTLKIQAAQYNTGTYGSGDYGVYVEPTTSDDSCTRSDPKGDIKIKSVSPGDTHLKVKFSGMKEPYNKFQIKWGVSTHLNTDYIGNDEFGDDKTTSYTIEDLRPDTKYYIKIRAVNGCNKGNWSDTVTATTLPQGSTAVAEVTNITTVPREAVQPEPTQVPQIPGSPTPTPSGTPAAPSKPASPFPPPQVYTYGLIVKVVSDKEEPLTGAKVHISGISDEKVTTSDGTVSFTDLDYGQYDINVTYNDQTANSVVNLNDPSVKDYEVTIKITPAPAKPIDKKLIIGISMLGAAVAGFIAFKLIKK